MLMKYIRLIVCAVLFGVVMTGVVHAAGSDADSAQDNAVASFNEALEVQELPRAVPDEAKGFVEGLAPDGQTADLNRGLDNVVRQVSGKLGGLLRDSVGSMLIILAIVLLCGIVGTFWEGAEGKTDTVVLVAVLAITAVSTGQVSGLMSLGRQVISDMDGFSKIIMPTLAAASTAAGAPMAGAARHMATMICSDLVLTMISRVIVPIVFAYVAAVAAGAALEQSVLTKIAGMLKWVATGLLTLSLTLFFAYMTISGALAGSADALAIKGARLALSGGIPVVGGIVSDAAETVLVGAGLVKNAVGLFGLFAVAGICLIPFLRVGIQYLLYKLMAAVVTPLAHERVTKLIENLSGAFGLILGMTGASALLLFISLISIISGAQIT